MAKLKNPLLSLDAKGTLGDALTYQDTIAPKVVRKKPIPAYRRTLAQAYQRWDYEDAIARWHTLSEATKAAWRAVGSRKHMTGFAAFMSDYLKTLPELLGRWTLDERVGAIAYDTSKNTNHGTIYGTTPAPGVIDSGRYFDAVDDYIDCGNHPSLNPDSEFTVYAFVKPEGAAAGRVAAKSDTNQWSWLLGIRPTGEGEFRALNSGSGAYMMATGTTNLRDGKKHHLAGTIIDPTLLCVYVDGVLEAIDTTTTGTWHKGTGRVRIGDDAIHYRYEGYIDHLVMVNRALPQPHILNLSERSYPV